MLLRKINQLSEISQFQKINHLPEISQLQKIIQLREFNQLPNLSQLQTQTLQVVQKTKGNRPEHLFKQL